MIPKMKLNETKNIAGGFDGKIQISHVRIFTRLKTYLQYDVTQFCPDDTGKPILLEYKSFNTASEAYHFANSLTPCSGQMVTPIKSNFINLHAYGDAPFIL